MDVPLLFQRKPKTNQSNLIEQVTILEQDYYDVENIRKLITESIKLPDNWQPPLRVLLIRSEPVRAFRLSIFCRFTTKRTVKNKDGSTSLVNPGVGVWKQFWIEKVSPLEFLIFPPFEKEKYE